LDEHDSCLLIIKRDSECVNVKMGSSNDRDIIYLVIRSVIVK